MTAVASAAVRIGTRGSALALVQAGIVAEALAAVGTDVRVETIVTDGDRRTPDTAWGEGAFVGAIEAALLEGRIDVAVHSAKDVPTDEDPRLTIAAYLAREPADDVIVLAEGATVGTGSRRRSLDLLPIGARVGTDSPRRTAFLRAARPDLRVHPLHGNVDTRLRRLDAGETDALVLAAAGLRRLGREDRISLVVPSTVMPPAPGQGALAIQVRSADPRTEAVVRRLDDPSARRAVEAERALLSASGGGCRAPLGAVGQVVGERLILRAGYARPDGRVAAWATRDGGPADDAQLVADTLADLADRAASAARAVGGAMVVVTRSRTDAAASLLALVDRGLTPLAVPAIEVAYEGGAVDVAELDAAVRDLPAYDWIVVTSAHAVHALAAAARRVDVDVSVPGPGWAAIGPATRRALRTIGVVPAFSPDRATGTDLGEGLPDVRGASILLPRSDLADGSLPDRLTSRGARVRPVVAYRTIEAPPTSGPALRAALGSDVAAVVAASPSAVRGWLALGRAVGLEDRVRSIPVVALGSTTAGEAERRGLVVIGRADTPDPAALADATLAAIHTLEEIR